MASYLLNENKTILKSEFENEQEFNLLTRKGVFPYDYVSNINVLEETQLPPREKFYNKMTESDISVCDYNHAQNVWNTFKCKTIGEYSDLYLKTDVLLLADVFLNFRETLMTTHKLDVCHYFTLPSYTWDAALMQTQVKLELLTDIDMILFFESAIRGGLSQASNRYSEANNKYMSDYDPNKQSKYIVYWDSNNLYAFALSKYLPINNFKWITNFENFNVQNIADDAETGYVLEVDIDYPEHLHDIHKDLPFLPVKQKPPGAKEYKLLTTLFHKERYILHYRNLKQALANGLVLKKIHRVLQFSQSPWLKSYIDLNTALRINADSDFEKNLYKLMNNAVFGKTMENVRNRVDVKLVSKWSGRHGVESLISKPNFHRRVIFDENLVAIEMKKMSVTIDKPIYIGMCVLDLSKTLMYDFHYNYILDTFKENVKMLYTDTDSFIYEFKCDDIYEYMKRDIDRFDTSNFPENNVYNMPRVNKKVMGKFKSETSSKLILAVISLRSKSYCIKTEDNI